MTRPGSLAWLLRHDLRLGWRGAAGGFGRLGPRSVTALLVAVAAVMHAVLWEVAVDAGALASDPASRGDAETLALPAAAFVLLLLVSQALNGAAKLLHGRGDLDLLLASPIPPARVLAARAGAVAIGALSSAAVFVLPLADDAALAGHPRLLALYPTVAGAAAMAAALGLGLILAMFRAMGPRRARLLAQVLATLVGAGFVIALQVGRLMPGLLPEGGLAEGGWPRAALTLPVRAAFGDPGALAAWSALSLAVFAAAAAPLGSAFARGVVAASGEPTSGRRAPRAGVEARMFGRGPGASLRAKEWRIVARDPWLVSQLLLQVLYMVPLAAVLWTGSGDPALALAPVVAVVAFQLASSLAWLGLSGEDAADLLATAPVAAASLRRAKLEAVGLPVLALVGPPLLCLAIASPAVAATTALVAGFAVAAAVALQGWHVVPGRRSAFAARHRESKVMGMIETAMSLLLGLAAALAALPSAWALAPVGLAGGLMLWLRPR